MSTNEKGCFSTDNDGRIQLTGVVKELVKIYCRLASKPYLTEDDEDKLNWLLELAESHAELDFWFNEADHFLAHELGLTSSDTICEVEKQQIQIQMFLKSVENSVVCSVEDEELESFEIHDNDAESIHALLSYATQFVTREVQTSLKSHGYDPGPEDGVLGEKTQSALKAFQKDKSLVPNGKPDPITKKALGIRD